MGEIRFGVAQMSEGRAQEIALKAIKMRFRREGINDDFSRNVGNAAKELELSTEEVRSSVAYMLPEMLAEILGLDWVKIEYGPSKKKMVVGG